MVHMSISITYVLLFGQAEFNMHALQLQFTKMANFYSCISLFCPLNATNIASMSINLL
jgi:hypothetical protein